MHRYKRLLAVAGFLGLLFVLFRLSGLQEHFSLAYVQLQFLHNKLSDMLIFIALFSLGNLVRRGHLCIVCNPPAVHL